MGLTIARRQDLMFSSWKEILVVVVPILAVIVTWAGNWLLELRKDVRAARREQADTKRRLEQEAADKAEADRQLYEEWFRDWTKQLQDQAREQQRRLDEHAKEQHLALRREVHEWRNNAQQLTGELEMLRRNARDADRDLAEMKTRLAAKEKEYARVLSDLEAKGSEIKVLREQLADAQEAVERGRQRIQELESQMAALQGASDLERGGNDV
jgi:chromosome segregation ATPase